MSEQTTGISNEERQVNKTIYVGKQMYRLFVDIANVLHDARKNKVPDAQLGIFAELDVDGYIAAAREIGQVPVWNAEDTPKGRTLKYPERSTGVAQ